MFKKFIHLVWISCLACFIVTSSVTASPYAKFKKIGLSKGLSQSSITNIIQDKEGFIWVATDDGLERYDGESFTHYRHNISDAHSIADNFIRKVFIDKSNTLWVGTDNGLSRYNKKFDNFDNFYHIENNTNSLIDNKIEDIYEDQGNANKNKPAQLWVSTQKGLHKFNPQSQNFDRIRIRGFKNKITQVKTIYQDSNKNYWFGTYKNGIYLVNENLSQATVLTEHSANSIQASALFDIKEIKDNFWLATDNGLFILDNHYQLIKHYDESTTSKRILSNEVRSIEVYNDDVWVGTFSGIHIFNLITGSITNYADIVGVSNSDGWLMDLYRDRDNRLWMASFGNGLSVLNTVSTKFLHRLNNKKIDVTSLTEDSSGKIWFTSDQVNLSYLSDSGDIIHYPLPIKETIYSVFSGEKNELWLLYDKNGIQQLSSLNFQNNKISHHPQWKNSQYSYPNILIYSSHEFWFINQENILTSYDTKSNKITNFFPPENIKLTAIGQDKMSQGKKLWLSGENDFLFTFNLTTKGFTQENFNSNSSFPLKETLNITLSKDWVWFSSLSHGLALYNRNTHQTKVFNEENGLANNYISSVLLDENQYAWTATNKGVSLVNPNNGSIKNFGPDYQIANTGFLDHSSLISSQNTFFFGGNNGFLQFDPVEILQISQEVPTPILTNLLVANKKVPVKKLKNNIPTYAKDFYLTQNLPYLDLLTLNHEQSPFSFTFVAPNAKLPHQIRYRYRLKGLEESWIEAGLDNKIATYTNLSSGYYTFELQAYDLHDKANVKSTQLNIRILPPWWLSQSALVIYALSALLCLAYVLQQMRHKRLYHLQIKLSEERLKLSLWGSGDEMWDWNIEKGKIYRSNIWGILEFPQDGKRNVGAEQTNIHEHDIPRVREALDEHFAKKSEHFEATYRVKDKENKWIWVLDRGKIVERNQQDIPTRMTGTLKDISQIKKADERLRLFAKCIENISDAVVIYDRQFNIVDINKSFQRITQLTKKEMVGTPLVFAQYPSEFTQSVKKHLITKGSWHGEIESKRSGGEIFLTDLNIDIIRDENNNISHFVGVFSDITKRKETEAELRKLANSDTLTSLPNRSYFQANQLRLVQNKIPHALLVFDLDNFKKINDSMGHEVGDVLLCKVAERLLSVGRKNDTVYRLGGDEFSIIVENTNEIHTITSIAKDILRTIAMPLKLRNQEVVLYSSIGIVLYPEDGISPQELLKNADTAMYHAKDTGGNKYQFFSDSMNKKAVKRLQIENLIRHGLKQDYFSVFYQPKIEIATGKVAGMEALVRFETPSKGIISPLAFIPVSEETGQIIDIGEIVLRKACFATKKWVDSGLFEGRIAVNLSAVQFTQPNLVEMISEILAESQLPAKYLELEITEGTVMNSPQAAIDTMLHIRSMGIHLSLDDFGTGYSSLAYLKKFPLNTLKIDKAFVDDIEHSEQGRNMVATIVTIAHNLGLQVVAEGVETSQQLSFLSGLRCEQLQGYLYSKPLPQHDFQKYLLSHQITDKSTSFAKR